MAITIKLNSAGLGDCSLVDEAYFDKYANWVAEHISEATGVDVAEIDQFALGDESEIEIRGATDEEEDAIIDWLSRRAFDAFCAVGTERAR